MGHHDQPLLPGAHVVSGATVESTCGVTPPDLDALERLIAHERVWAAPWVARTFEIDCPCPNGEHCGDSHSCEEVEAREEYPNGAPGEPADEGSGQCVVQISVPGLATFAGPTAAAIAALRNAAPELLRLARLGLRAEGGR